MRAMLIALTGLGVGLLVGGFLSFVFGGWVCRSPLLVAGMGPFNGLWSSADYCFVGGIQAAVGAALTAIGKLGLSARAGGLTN